MKLPNYLQARPPQGHGAQQMHNKDPTPKNGEKRARWAGALEPDPWNRAPAREASPAKRTRKRTRKTNQDPRPRRSPFPRVHSPLRKDAFCLLAAPVAGRWSREGTILPQSPRRLLPCWQHMPLVGCLLELQAGLARSAVTQERSPGALARRNPPEGKRIAAGTQKNISWRSSQDPLQARPP